MMGEGGVRRGGGTATIAALNDLISGSGPKSWRHVAVQQLRQLPAAAGSLNAPR